MFSQKCSGGGWPWLHFPKSVLFWPKNDSRNAVSSESEFSHWGPSAKEEHHNLMFWNTPPSCNLQCAMLTCLQPRLLFPLEASRRKSLKNGEQILNSPPRFDPRKWVKITEKLQKLYFQSSFSPFLGKFPHFWGVGPGRGIWYFFPIFRGFLSGRLPGPSKGKSNSQHLLATSVWLWRLSEEQVEVLPDIIVCLPCPLNGFLASNLTFESLGHGNYHKALKRTEVSSRYSADHNQSLWVGEWQGRGCCWLLVLAHQNRTIAIASDFRVDGAKSPECPRERMGFGVGSRSSRSQIASDLPSHP